MDHEMITFLGQLKLPWDIMRYVWAYAYPRPAQIHKWRETHKNRYKINRIMKYWYEIRTSDVVRVHAQDWSYFAAGFRLGRSWSSDDLRLAGR